MRSALVGRSIPVLVLVLAAGLSPSARGAEKDDPAKPDSQAAEKRIKELEKQLAAVREREAALVKQLQRADEDLPMAWEADGRRLEKVIHAIVLNPELPKDAPPEWGNALRGVSRPVVVWKLQRVKGDLVWTVERAKDAAIMEAGSAKDAPPEWREALKDLPRQVIVWTLDAEEVKR